MWCLAKAHLCLLAVLLAVPSAGTQTLTEEQAAASVTAIFDSHTANLNRPFLHSVRGVLIDPSTPAGKEAAKGLARWYRLTARYVGFGLELADNLQGDPWADGFKTSLEVYRQARVGGRLPTSTEKAEARKALRNHFSTGPQGNWRDAGFLTSQGDLGEVAVRVQTAWIESHENGSDCLRFWPDDQKPFPNDILLLWYLAEELNAGGYGREANICAALGMRTLEDVGRCAIEATYEAVVPPIFMNYAVIAHLNAQLALGALFPCDVEDPAESYRLAYTVCRAYELVRWMRRAGAPRPFREKLEDLRTFYPTYCYLHGGNVQAVLAASVPHPGEDDDYAPYSEPDHRARKILDDYILFREKGQFIDGASSMGFLCRLYRYYKTYPDRQNLRGDLYTFLSASDEEEALLVAKEILVTHRLAREEDRPVFIEDLLSRATDSSEIGVKASILAGNCLLTSNGGEEAFNQAIAVAEHVLTSPHVSKVGPCEEMELCYIVGIANHAMGKHAEGLPWFERGISLGPLLSETYYGPLLWYGAECAKRAGRDEEAWEYARELKKWFPDADRAFRADRYLELGEFAIHAAGLD